MRLSSDYAQWYDEIFDDSGPTFHRMAFTRGGLSKREQLALFDRLGLKTPPHGIVRALAERVSPFGAPIAADLECIVYEDELAHRGQGKLRLSIAAALDSHPDHYATLFVPTGRRAVNMRHVRFGRLGFWLRQTARGEDWRSNVDDEETLVARTLHTDSPIARVLWAIDFLPSAFGLLAVDLNTAPELVTLGETKAVTAAEVLAELEHAAATEPRTLAQL